MLSDQIKEVMAACSLTQAELAEIMEVKLQRVKNIAAGRVQKLTPDESKRLVQKLALNGNWLALGKGRMFLTPKERRFNQNLDNLGVVSKIIDDMQLADDQAALARDIAYAVNSNNRDLLVDTLTRITNENQLPNLQTSANLAGKVIDSDRMERITQLLERIAKEAGRRWPAPRLVRVAVEVYNFLEEEQDGDIDDAKIERVLRLVVNQ